MIVLLLLFAAVFCEIMHTEHGIVETDECMCTDDCLSRETEHCVHILFTCSCPNHFHGGGDQQHEEAFIVHVPDDGEPERFEWNPEDEQKLYSDPTHYFVCTVTPEGVEKYYAHLPDFETQMGVPDFEEEPGPGATLLIEDPGLPDAETLPYKPENMHRIEQDPDDFFVLHVSESTGERKYYELLPDFGPASEAPVEEPEVPPAKRSSKW